MQIHFYQQHTSINQHLFLWTESHHLSKVIFATTFLIINSQSFFNCISSSFHIYFYQQKLYIKPQLFYPLHLSISFTFIFINYIFTSIYMCFYQLHHSINTKLFFQLHFSINPQLFLWPASLHQPIFIFINCISSSIQSFLSTAYLRQSTFIFINCNSPSIHSYFSTASLHQSTSIFIICISPWIHFYFYQFHLSIKPRLFLSTTPLSHFIFIILNCISPSMQIHFSTAYSHQYTFILTTISFYQYTVCFQLNFTINPQLFFHLYLSINPIVYQLHLSIYPQLFLSTVCLQQSKFILIFCISLSIHNYIFSCTLYVNPHLFLSVASLDLSAFIFINSISPWIHMSFINYLSGSLSIYYFQLHASIIP